MSKKYYCANCGIEIKVNQKVVPHEGRVIYLILPHVCGEILSADKGGNKKPLDKFPFVSKINKATAEYESVSKLQKAGDKRDKTHIRQELPTSSAPLSVLDIARNK